MKPLCRLSVLLGLVLAGCKSANVENPQPPAPTQDVIAAAKAKYASLPGAVVGEVVSVLERDSLVGVSGMDPKALAKDRRVSILDARTDQLIAAATYGDVTPSGLVILQYDKGAARAPRIGDLAVQLK